MALIFSGVFFDAKAQYISGKVGYTSFSDVATTPGSFAFSLAYGFGGDVSETVGLRGEFEYANLGNWNTKINSYTDVNNWEKGKSSTNVNAYLANVYIDFLKDFKVKPYISASGGFVNTSTKNNYEYKWKIGVVQEEGMEVGTDSLLSIAYGFGAGASTDITKSLKADAGVRLVFASIEGESFNKIINASVGLRYEF